MQLLVGISMSHRCLVALVSLCVLTAPPHGSFIVVPLRCVPQLFWRAPRRQALQLHIEALCRQRRQTAPCGCHRLAELSPSRHLPGRGDSQVPTNPFFPACGLHEELCPAVRVVDEYHPRSPGEAPAARLGFLLGSSLAWRNVGCRVLSVLAAITQLFPYGPRWDGLCFILGYSALVHDSRCNALHTWPGAH